MPASQGAGVKQPEATVHSNSIICCDGDLPCPCKAEKSGKLGHKEAFRQVRRWKFVWKKKKSPETVPRWGGEVPKNHKNSALSRQHLYLFPGKLRTPTFSSHFNTDRSQISTHHIPFITPSTLPTFPPVFVWVQWGQDTQVESEEEQQRLPTCRINSIWTMEAGSFVWTRGRISSNFTFSKTKSLKPRRAIWRIVNSWP